MKYNMKYMQSKPEYYDEETMNSCAIELEDCHKYLNIKGIDFDKLYEILKENKIIKSDKRLDMQYVDNGYFRVIQTQYIKSDSSSYTEFRIVIFPKGIKFIK